MSRDQIPPHSNHIWHSSNWIGYLLRLIGRQTCLYCIQLMNPRSYWLLGLRIILNLVVAVLFSYIKESFSIFYQSTILLRIRASILISAHPNLCDADSSATVRRSLQAITSPVPLQRLQSLITLSTADAPPLSFIPKAITRCKWQSWLQRLLCYIFRVWEEFYMFVGPIGHRF